MQQTVQPHISGFNLQPLFWAILCLFSLLPAISQAALQSHDHAVELARAGQYSKAIAILEDLHRLHPQNTRITNDLIVVYCWNNQYSPACSLFEDRPADTYPDYVLTDVLTAYRSLQQPDKALTIVDLLLKRQPGADDLLLYKALLLVDKRELDSARTILDTISNSGKNSRYYRLSGYLHGAEENWLAALADYQQLKRMLPDDKSAVREQFFALQYVRAEYAAGNIMADHEQLFSAHDRAMLLLNQAAEKLRWSTDAARDFNETKLLAFQALEMQIQALDLLGTGPAKNNWPAPVLNDLAITLRNLRQMDSVKAIYQSLLDRGEVPNYVRQAAAGAMLDRRYPDRARELYRQIAEQEPDNFHAHIGLFYSYVEEEDFDNAYRLIDELFEKEPVFQTFADKKYRTHNDRYLDLGVYTILARYYGDQLEEAWSRIDTLISNAPLNDWLYEIRGQISNSREWYRQALYDFHYASLLDPDNLNARAGEIASLLLLRQYDRARPMLNAIRQQFPDEHPTRRLEKEWKFSRKPEYWGDITYGSSSGPKLDGDGMLISGELLSSPINDSLYIDALYRYAWNEIIEGEETFQRYSLGLNYHLVNWDFLGRVTYNNSSLDEIGGSVQGIWTPDDYWRLTLAGERFSVDTPLRALYHGIRSDSISASLNYRWSEQRDLFLAAQGSSFTDNNDRIAGSAVLRQRLVDIPHVDIDGRIEAYGSANSRRDTPYFNPESDFSLLGAFHLDHVYYRHNDHLLAQQIDVGYGFYDQKGYGSRWIGHIRYEQRYKFTPWVEILAGIEFGQNVYDGQAEPYQLVRFMINGKF